MAACCRERLFIDARQDSEASALCCMGGLIVMSSATNPSRRTSITARPMPEEKRRFAALAASRGMSEASLALLAIRALLESNGLAVSRSVIADRDAPVSDRITVRLRPGDRRAVTERAGGRGMKDATYIAALVRAHVAANPPLPTDELAAFKQAVSILVALGRLLTRYSRGGILSPESLAELRNDLSRTRAVTAEVESRMHAFASAALASWESRYD